MLRYASALVCASLGGASLTSATVLAAGDWSARARSALPVEVACMPGRSAATAACISPPDTPRFDVGDTIAAKVALRSYFPGMDLMRVTGDLGYYRTDEYVYLVDRRTGGVLEVIRIADVILR